MGSISINSHKTIEICHKILRVNSAVTSDHEISRITLKNIKGKMNKSARVPTFIGTFAANYFSGHKQRQLIGITVLQIHKINSKTFPQISCRQYSAEPLLQKIGEYETPTESDYQSGQLFIHNVFGYRGVILFPWTVQVFEKDETMEFGKDTDNTSQAQIVPKVQNYYQALIDSRDFPNVNAHSESVTFLGGSDNSRSLYTIPGLDYVNHDDIQPYTSVEEIPIQHELFDKFLSYKPGSGKLSTQTDTLLKWKEKNHACLELTKVHREVTDGIRVTAMPFYLGYKDDNNSQEYWWRYCIRIENLMSNTTVRLRERHWRIISNGAVKTVRGRGVIGREPILTETQPAFQYSSHVSLHSPNGHMWGIFRMERVDGFQFDARIPAYALESKPPSNQIDS